MLSDHAFALFVHHRARVGTVSSEPAREPFQLKDSPLNLKASRTETGRDGGREDDVRAPALEMVVPRAIPVATGGPELPYRQRGSSRAGKWAVVAGSQTV
jgi:hypothetical protein